MLRDALSKGNFRKLSNGCVFLRSGRLASVSGTAPAQELLRAGTIFSATQAPLWAAKEGHYFEKYGIKNLEIIQFSGGQPVTRALIGGDIQISTTGGAAVVNARLRVPTPSSSPEPSVCFPIRSSSAKIFAMPRTERAKARCQHRRRLRLRGDAVRAQKTWFGSRQRCRHAADRRLRHAPGVASAGTVQGALLLPPFTLRARELGLRPLYDLVGSGIQYPINQITVRQSFIKSHRETVKSFMRAFVAGLARFRTDREFGARLLGKNLRESDPKILQETYDFWLEVFPRVPNPGPEDATVFLELMQVKEQRDWRDFVDTSVMDELQREGFLNSVYK